MEEATSKRYGQALLLTEPERRIHSWGRRLAFRHVVTASSKFMGQQAEHVENSPKRFLLRSTPRILYSCRPSALHTAGLAELKLNEGANQLAGNSRPKKIAPLVLIQITSNKRNFIDLIMNDSVPRPAERESPDSPRANWQTGRQQHNSDWTYLTLYEQHCRWHCPTRQLKEVSDTFRCPAFPEKTVDTVLV